jgi:hypothetical protein
MHHSIEQLDVLWHALKSSDPALRSKVLQRYSNPKLNGALPEIMCDDEHAQVLSIPTPDHPGRHVYVRQPGGAWGEQH